MSDATNVSPDPLEAEEEEYDSSQDEDFDEEEGAERARSQLDKEQSLDSALDDAFNNPARRTRGGRDAAIRGGQDVSDLNSGIRNADLEQVKKKKKHGGSRKKTDVCGQQVIMVV